MGDQAFENFACIKFSEKLKWKKFCEYDFSRMDKRGEKTAGITFGKSWNYNDLSG